MNKITKNPLVIIMFLAIVMYVLYFLMSPYERCIKKYNNDNPSAANTQKASYTCGEVTKW